ncbi:MAG: HDIG domain-containing protein [Phycisphaeraceae bacterium]|nr:HDIG domain-containing protein [Phycisphaeraceae bacterium]
MAQSKTTTARRREVRRNLPKARGAWREVLRKPEIGWSVLYAMVFAVVATVIASPLIDRARPLQLGQAVEEAIVSRVAFSVVDEDKTRMDRRVAADKIPPYFKASGSLYDRLSLDLETLPSTLAGYEVLEDVPKTMLVALGMEATDAEETAAQKETRLKKNQRALDALRRFADSEQPQLIARWQRLAPEMIDALFDTPIIEETELQAHLRATIVIEHPKPSPDQAALRVKSSRAVLSLDDAAQLDIEIDQIAAGVPTDARDAVTAFIQSGLEPTYNYSAVLTESAKEAARQAVPDRIEPLNAGVVLARPGDNVTQTLKDTVEAEEAAYLAARSPMQRWLPRAAMLGLMMIVASGMWVYFFAYSPRVVRNPMRAAVLTALLLICLAASVSSSLLWPDIVIGSLTFPVLFAATVLAIAYDQRFALAMGVVMALLVVVMLKLPLATTVIVIVGVAAAVMQLREIRSRSKLVIVGTYAGLAMGVTAAVVGLAVKTVWVDGVLQTVLIDALAAITSGFFTGLLVQGALPVIEKLFNVTTAMTLKELNDVSHPLLQRLAHEAPGTYQHSLRIADMAEGAAEAVDADALLCRVGAMYHDIGKTNKPMYFIENQAGGPNKHSKLSPAMSLLIIVGHVKDGVEMAREFALPGVIRHFIESHHGTTLVEYFFHEAKKQTEAEDKPSPSEFEFRYPGPKPQTREAAIMMLCDCVEGAARAMDEPTATRLENLVKTMASKRLMDGQFDDCDMTLQDLSRIEKALTKSLCAMYHQRIKYPEDKKLSDTATGKQTAAG